MCRFMCVSWEARLRYGTRSIRLPRSLFGCHIEGELFRTTQRQGGIMASPPSYDTQSCDGKPLAGLAKRYPNAKTTKDPVAGARLASDRKAVVKLVDLALKYPEFAGQCWAQCETVLQKCLEDKEKAADRFSEQYTKAWRLPGTWKGPFITLISKGAISDEALARLVTDNKGSQQVVHDIFYYITGTKPQESLPSLCQSKRVCSKTFALRHEQAGLQYRIDRVAEALKGNATTLDWLAFGAFKVQFQGGTAIKITHDSGEEATVPKGDSFTNAWKLYDSFLDEDCYIAAPKTKRNLKLSTYFDEGEGPCKKRPSLDEMARVAHAELEKQLKELQSSLVAAEGSNAVAEATRAHKRSMAQARANTMVAAQKKAKLDGGIAMLPAIEG